MKWWGWGDPDVRFTHEDKPELAPFLREDARHRRHARRRARAARSRRLQVPEPNLPGALRAALERAADVSTDAAGPRRARARQEPARPRPPAPRRARPAARTPSCGPPTRRAVEAVVRAVLEADAVLIPFGGGTSISGSLEAPGDESRPVVSLDLSRLSRVLDIDPIARLARVQAGALGPDLERQLAERGWTLGHFPDSFTHSTLGGWIATRSSGMQSDRYGDIAELTRAVRVVTPAGMLATRPVPATSTGPSVREMVLGSEGRLGVITEATVHVQRLPAERVILGYLFPDWERGARRDARHRRQRGAAVGHARVRRLRDARSRSPRARTRRRSTGVKSLALRTYLARRRGFDVGEMCLSFIGYEGTERHVAAQRKLTGRIVSRHGGVCIGASPGRALRPEEVRHAVHPRLPARPRHARRRVGDRGAVERAAPALRRGDGRRARGVRRARRPRLHHVPPVALLPRGRVPVLHVRVRAARRRRPARAVRAREVGDPAGVRRQRRHALAPPRRRDGARASGSSRTSPRPGAAMLRALFDGVDPGHNLNPGKIV